MDLNQSYSQSQSPSPGPLCVHCKDGKEHFLYYRVCCYCILDGNEQLLYKLDPCCGGNYCELVSWANIPLMLGQWDAELGRDKYIWDESRPLIETPNGMHQDNIDCFRTYYDMGYQYRSKCGSVVCLASWGSVCPPPPRVPTPPLNSTRANIVRCLICSNLDLDYSENIDLIDGMVPICLKFSNVDDVKYNISSQYVIDSSVSDDIISTFEAIKDIKDDWELVKYMVSTRYSACDKTVVNGMLLAFLACSKPDEFVNEITSSFELDDDEVNILVDLFKAYKIKDNTITPPLASHT